ncbi:BON domain-containing protein [Undibacterium sp.]|uniref:BON domain-containing protein n=1 Tax=Undibacterium sp. TaxID=1914977 RepID=UPI00374DE290
MTSVTSLSNRTSARSATAIAVLALIAALSACNKTQDATTAAPPKTVGTQVDDSVVTAKVRTALVQDSEVKALDIKVTTDKGQVMLSGFADSQAQIDRSLTVAKGVEGVAGVDNKLSLKEGTQTVGNKIDDSVITAQVKSAMLADPDMKSLDVSVTTRKGEVQLSGFVNNDTQLTHAVDVAKNVDGVVTVVNHMSLKK